MNTLISFLKEAYHRLHAETPAFFKTVIKFGAGLIALGGLPTAVQMSPVPVHLPESLLVIAHYGMAIGGAIVFVAKFACKNILHIPLQEDEAANP